MIKRSIFLILLLSFFCITACSSNRGNSSVSAEALAERIEDSVPLESGYYRVSEAYFEYYFPEISADEWVICRSSSQASENEFGIILTSGNASAVQAACEDYLEAQLNAYIASKASYSPSEYEKYRDASVKVIGNYVIYAIMTTSDQKTAFSSAESLLK